MTDQQTPAAGTQQHFSATRTSRAWWALAAGLFFLLLVLIFMVQNGDKVDVHFLWLKWRDVALGIALFGAAVLGSLSVLLLGLGRMLQMRRQAKRAHRGDEGPE